MISSVDLIEITGLALVITLSPVPVAGQLLLVLNSRSQWTSGAFVTGWALAILALCALAETGAALLLPRLVFDWSEVALVTVIVGAGLAVAGVVLWRRLPASTDAEPSRVAKIFAGLGPTRGLLIGVGYGGFRPKNFIAAIAAGLIIGAGSSLGEGTLLVVYFALIGSASLAAPVLVYVLGGHRTRAGMRRPQALLSRNGNRITGSALIVIGAIVAGFGLLQLFA
jgi:hypothetical protein